ncbi:hypothetical protein G7Y89_g12226 [Cudoniella acicularis]|uniref:Uncharacterized protein n=1 Tax=Cudoniella acicularis TaxID=354080 RepID=A0A8H4R999_9HELO|nr:hypothetical protein G7Y89_g12226 [Cudoniella acicularis]
MMHTSRSNTRSDVRDKTESRRALELRKFFAPYSLVSPSVDVSFNSSLNNDAALDAYAETIIWRLRGVHCMVRFISLFGRFISAKSFTGSQYFLAGATRKFDENDEDLVHSDGSWFGCSTLPTAGGLSLDTSITGYPCFTINDLTEDPRFSSLPVVNGEIAAYRFYAGTPITTSHVLHQKAANIMRHLETKREAAERRRVALMSKGIANFLEKTSRENDSNLETSSTSHTDDANNNIGEDQTSQIKPKSQHAVHNSSSKTDYSVLDKIRITLDHAADILRESLELNVGGVAFLDGAIGYTDSGYVDTYLDAGTERESRSQHLGEETKKETFGRNPLRPPLSKSEGGIGRHLSQGAVRSSADKHKPSKVLAMSTAKIASWDPQLQVVDVKTLQSLITSYPNGNVWYIDEDGYFSSLEQVGEMEKTLGASPSGRRRSISPSRTNQQQVEASLLSKIFQKARQIIFLPLWDAAGDRWHSGCFVWSQSAVPVFTVDSEIAYLSAFTNSVMVEISRLDAITANKVKSDFISSISHEFRSPLHGILASAEFLRESDLDPSQLEFISTIQNCGETLLDTINHVLDYSKINSFEKSGNNQGTVANELYQITNLALLCEDIVNGMIAAKEYRGTATGPATLPVSNDFLSPYQAQLNEGERAALQVIIDIEQRDWDFKVQAGALRRVVMNIFGNAQKYTDSGYIIVQLRVQDASETSPKKSNSSGKVLSLHIRDSGKGMSSEYMERKLYHPFAQEDSFAPGVGLGLSIVWSIVNQLGGKIHIRSELGKGTDVEVTIPIEKAQGLPISPSDSNNASTGMHEVISSMQERAKGKSVRVCKDYSKTEPAAHEVILWSCIEKYCSAWFGFEITSSAADLVITNKCVLANHLEDPRVLVVHGDNVCMVCPKRANDSAHLVTDIYTPIGPFKLARCILALLDLNVPSKSGSCCGSRTDAGTQTPLGSPEERRMLNGIILTDYGFPAQAIPGVLASRSGSPSQSANDSREIVNATEEETGSQQALLTMRSLSLQQPPTPKQTPPQPRPPIPATNTQIIQPALSDSSTSAEPPPATAVKTEVNRTLPLPLPDSTSTTAKATNGLHILAVDDNALNLQLLQRYLKKRKSDTVVTARNGIEAVTACKNALSNPDPTMQTFDVIFMDISMPEMDGFEATRIIRCLELSSDTFTEGTLLEDGMDGIMQIERKVKHRAHVVALTGLASRRDRDEAVESGLDDFLTKPVSFAKIGELLGRLSREKTVVGGGD